MCWHLSLGAFLLIYFPHILFHLWHWSSQFCCDLAVSYLFNGPILFLSILTPIRSTLLMPFLELHFIFLVTLHQMCFFRLPAMWWVSNLYLYLRNLLAEFHGLQTKHDIWRSHHWLLGINHYHFSECFYILQIKQQSIN